LLIILESDEVYGKNTRILHMDQKTM